MTNQGEKRFYEESRGDAKESHNDKRLKLPALANVILEAVKVESLQKLCSGLEPLLRRVVGEEVERALARLAPSLLERPAIERPPELLGGGGSLRLQFKNRLALPLFTGSRVEGETGTLLHVVLQDAATGEVVTRGDVANVQLEVCVLEGDFDIDDDHMWSEEEFEQHVIKERPGKRPLLTGDLALTLRDGIGTVGQIAFTDNSSWIRSRKFKLGVRVIAGGEGVRIREAKTEAFTVKDHRGELYKKHYPPALHDEVWRLDRIGKDGAFHKRLNEYNVVTVEDFLRMVVTDPGKLRNILGSGMNSKMWEGTVEHSKTCVLNGKLFVYYADVQQGVGVLFNSICQLMGLMAEGRFLSIDTLTENEKLYVDRLVKLAYERWDSVVEYTGNALIGYKPVTVHEMEASAPSPRGFVAQTVQQPMITLPAPSHSTSNNHSSPTAGPRSRPSSRLHAAIATAAAVPNGRLLPTTPATNDAPESAHVYLLDHQNSTTASDAVGTILSPNPSMVERTTGMVRTTTGMVPSMNLSFDEGVVGTGPPPTSNATGAAHSMDAQTLALVTEPRVHSWANLGPELSIESAGGEADGREGGLSPDSFPIGDLLDLSEDDVRMKSAELLGDDDMHQQLEQLLHMFSNSQGDGGVMEGEGGGIPQSPDLNALLPPFSPSDLVVPRHGNKATIGWLKIKAALRWGIFIRKRAARRRAEAQAEEEAASTAA